MSSPEIIIRPAQPEDAEGIQDFLRETIVAETQYVISLPEELILDGERQKAWIIEYEKNDDAIMVVAVTDERKIVGVLDFKPFPRKRLSHSGEFGISVRPGYQGAGIGQRILVFFLKWAAQREQITKVNLSVFASNTRAIHIYEKFGFVKEGLQKNAVRMSEGVYEDLWLMTLLLK